MSVDTLFAPKTRPRWIALAVVGVAVVAGVFAAPRLLRRSGAPAVSGTGVVSALQTVVEGEAGKVGDLVITEEAMQLAEIKIAPAQQRVVAEELTVSGNIEAGGDRLARITPRVAGKVLSLSAVVGDSVRAGQTLGLIESTELAQAQAAYQQATARVAAAQNNLERQQKLAQLGAFGQPRVQDARAAAVAAQEAVRTAESEVAGAQAVVEEAQSELKALQAALSQAQTQARVVGKRFERAERLLKEELISRQEWEQTQADYENAQADVEAARAKIAQGEAKVETARAGLNTARARLDAAEKQAQIASQVLAREEAVYKGRFLTGKEIVEADAALRQAQIDQQAAAQAVRLLGGAPGGGSIVALTTPIAGRVQERNVSLGEMVDTEHPLFTILNLNTVWAQLAVAPRDLPSVRAGQRVELTSETAPGRLFTGTVSAIGSTAEEATRAVRVRVALANPGDALKPGTFVRGRIITDVRREKVTVPLDALQEHTGRPTVYVAKAGQETAFEVRHVILGVRGENWREIASGLRAGERIAVSGTFYLKSEALKNALSDGCCAVPGGG